LVKTLFLFKKIIMLYQTSFIHRLVVLVHHLELLMKFLLLELNFFV